MRPFQLSPLARSELLTLATKTGADADVLFRVAAESGDRERRSLYHTCNAWFKKVPRHTLPVAVINFDGIAITPVMVMDKGDYVIYSIVEAEPDDDYYVQRVIQETITDMEVERVK